MTLGEEAILRAIRENTKMQREVAKAILAQTAAVARLADECVNLAALVVNPDEDDQPPTHDMSGKPIPG